MGRDEAKEQTFQALLNVRHTYYLQGALDCAVLFPLLVWKFKRFVTSLLAFFLAVIKGGLGSAFHFPTAQNWRFCSGKGRHSIGLSRLLVTECWGKVICKIIRYFKGICQIKFVANNSALQAADYR